MRNRVFQILVFIFSAIALIAVAGWALLTFFTSTDVVRNAIERGVVHLTGQQVSIGDDTEITLFPTPKATLKNLVIAGRATGEGKPPIASVEAVELDISMGSLVTGQPSFSAVRLIKPVFTLDINNDTTFVEQLPLRNVRQGVRIALEQRNKEREANDEQSVGQDPRPAIVYPEWLEQRIGMMTIVDGQVDVALDSQPPAVYASAINGTLNWPRLNSPLAIEGTSEIDGQTVTFTITTPQPVDALAGEIAGLTIEANADIAGLSFNGEFGFASGLFAQGDVSFNTDSVRRLLAWRKQTIQAGRSLGALSLTAQVQTRSATMRLNNLNIVVDGNEGSGVLELSQRESGPPALVGTLDFETLDLRAFIGAFTNLPRSATNKSEIDTSFMSQLQTDLRVSANTASFDDTLLTNVAATAQTTPDLALFDIGDASTFGGTLQARLRFDQNPDKPTVDLSLNGQDIDMTAAKAALMLPAILPVGEANFNWKLTAPIGRWSDVFNNASGKIGIRQAQGGLAGFGPAILEASEPSQFVPIETESAPIDFSSFVLDALINNGEIKVKDSKIDYGDGSSINLNGVVQLASRSLALTARAIAPDTDTDLPSQRFFIGGGWNAPYVFAPLASPVSQPPQ